MPQAEFEPIIPASERPQREISISVLIIDKASDLKIYPVQIPAQ